MKKITGDLFSFLLIFLSISTLYAGDSIFRVPTKFLQQIHYKLDASGSAAPAYIKINNEIVFQTEKNQYGDYDSFCWAGNIFATPPAAPGWVQYGKSSGREICLRWVIQAGVNPIKHYIIDFTTKKPIIIGPFGQDNESQGRVKRIIWSKRFATIEFISTNKYYYEYIPRKISFQEEP